MQYQEYTQAQFDKEPPQQNSRKGDLVSYGIKERKNQVRWFENIWLGRYQTENVAGNDFFYLSHLYGEKLSFPVKGKSLKIFYSSDI